jgi:sulfoxide reductase heme-binding subunit YedZ
MIRQINDGLRRIPVWAIWLAGLIPLALLVWDVLTGAVGVDPIPKIEHRLGRTALYFLIGSLAVTPVLRLTGITLIRFRRALGLLCFTYVVLHVLTWILLDMGLLWSQMARDVVKRPYLIFGMSALLLLIPVALTSNNLSIRRLGGKRWKRLHQLVYPAAILVPLHWIWALKTFPVRPVFWLIAILLLLALRPLLAKPRRAGSPGRTS